MKLRRDAALPVLGALTILLLWQFLVPALGVPRFIVPTPLAVLGTFVRDAPLIAANALPTALESVGGFVLGNLVAVAVAMLFVANRTLRKAYFPVVLFFNTIPVLALAPIIVLIFGLGMFPKIVVAAVICFFPTLVNMIRGLESPTANELELMRVLSASTSEVFRDLRFPRSLPFLFAGLRVAAQGSVVGAIVGEWIGTNKGLGALIIESTFNYHAERLYASVIVSALLAIVFFNVVVLAERRFLRYAAPGA
ncbi:MAG TPA: ABC transporter permease [Candidatus Limnocylindria bacterium]|jgi:NitT/TauT family transport system permease protein|nr:ABC transporter permease [Candidatus Limnocylindria bacterium]